VDVILDKLAKLELDDAAQYYELQIPGLGIRFEEEVKLGIRRILEYPMGNGKRRYQKIRAAQISV